MSDIPDERFYERLDWNGSKKTKDLQDGSIYILNVTWNDTGTYRCIFTRTLTFSSFKFHNDTTKIVHLNVVPRREALALGFTGLGLGLDTNEHMQRNTHTTSIVDTHPHLGIGEGERGGEREGGREGNSTLRSPL